MHVNDLNINQLYVLLAIFVRIYASMLICPLFNKAYFTNVLRGALSLVLALLMLPMFSQVTLDVGLWAYSAVLIKEFVYGVILSYILGLPFWLIAGVGNIIDLQRGEQLGAVINRTTSTPASSLSKLLLQAFIAYFAVTNGLLFFFNLVFKSFKLLPLGSGFLMAHSMDVYIDTFVSYVYWVVILAAPLMILMLLLDLTLGMIGSLIPQLNVTVLSIPLKSALAILLLIFYI
ncbi:MAG: EscT/YscT/HrcT family type III secretion system export apparatus protein, partial [Burkholderiales bacterium]